MRQGAIGLLRQFACCPRPIDPPERRDAPLQVSFLIDTDSVMEESLIEPFSTQRKRHAGLHAHAPDTEGMTMHRHRIFATAFAKVYPLYVQKAERKNRTKEEVDRVICWLTGYDPAGLQRQIEQEADLETFFAQAPAIHPNSSLIKGVVCGIRVEEVEDPLMKKIRHLDKLIDELAKGKAMEKILRQ
jgi:hypothetical protein